MPFGTVTIYWAGSAFTPDETVGKVHFDPDWPGGLEEGAVRTEFYIPLSEVSLTAEYELTYAFEHWEDFRVSPTTGPLGVEYNTSPLHSFVVAEGENHEINAVFEPGATLVATVASIDSGDTPVDNEEAGAIQLVPDHPGGIQDGATRLETFLFDTEVEMTALHKEGYVFDYWLEDEVQYNSDPLRSIVAAQDVYTTAVFRPGIPLSVTTAYDQFSGSGLWVADETVGEVHFTPDPPGDPEDGAYRSETYWPDQAVSVAPFPNMGFAFHHWEEDGAILEDDNHTYSLVIEEPRWLTAVFHPGYALMAAVDLYDESGTYILDESVGDIVITPDYPGGSDDGLVQVEHYLDDTEVRLLAEPGDGFQFDYWEGTISDYVNPVTVTMLNDETATAVFYPLTGTTYTLTTSVANAGAGEVHPPSGRSYGAGKLVAPWAEANPGWRFDHWSGDLSNSWNPTVVVMDSDISITAHFVETRVLEMASGNGGDVVPSPGEHIYDIGTAVTVTATPWDEGYRFSHWVGNVADAQSATTTVTLDADETVTPVFVRRYLLDTEFTGIGSVSPADGRYDDGATVTITATQTDDDWHFKRWEGDVADPDSATTTVAMDEDQTVTAVFVTTYTLTVNPATGGSVTTVPSGTTFDSDVTVELTANPDTGWRFDEWQGDLTGSVNPGYLLMDADKTVTPVFVETADLTLETVGEGTVLADGVELGGTTTFDKNTSPQLEAVPADGYRFDHWENALTGSTNPETLTMDADKTVRAVFIQTFQLEIIEYGSGDVALDPAPDPAPDPDEGIYTYDVGTPVECTATPGSGHRFQRWEGHVSGIDNPVTVTMDANKTVAARFIGRVQLTMAKDGQGTITPAEGTETYDFQALVDITATPATGWMFVQWLSDGVEDPLNGSTQNPAQVVADMPPPGQTTKTVTAVFREERTLTTAVDGPLGCGTIHPPSGIYPDGSILTVIATANENYTFDHWTGSLIGFTNPADVVMNADVTAIAVFVEEVIQTYTLTVTQTGEGTIGPLPGTYTHNDGAWVGLNATAAFGYVFDHWECDGQFLSDENESGVLMDADKTVRAVFHPDQAFTLTVCIEGQGTTNPVPGTYADLDWGEKVPLTATPSADGWLFEHWDWDGGGEQYLTSSPTTNVIMYQDMTVTAVFKESSWTKYRLTLGTEPDLQGQGISVEEYIDSGDGFPRYYPVYEPCFFDPGTVLRLFPRADENHRFVHWGGDTSGVEAWKSLTMNSDKTVTAHFVDTRTPGITVHTSGNGTVTLDPPSSFFELPVGDYPKYEYVTISATPSDGDWMLASLRVDGRPFLNGSPFQITGRHIVTAVFKERRTLDIVIQGSGTVETYPSAGPDFPHGTEVTLYAVPDYGWTFSGWGGDLATCEENPATLVMDSDKSVTAIFTELPTFTLTTQATVNGVLNEDAGYFEVDPAPLPDGAYPQNTVVEVTAAANPNYKLVGWTDPPKGAANPISVCVTGNETVTADFLWHFRTGCFYVLVLELEGGGSVTITPAPDEEELLGTNMRRLFYKDDPGEIHISNPQPAERFQGWEGYGFREISDTEIAVEPEYVCAPFVCAPGATPEKSGRVWVRANLGGVPLWTTIDHATGSGIMDPPANVYYHAGLYVPCAYSIDLYRYPHLRPYIYEQNEEVVLEAWPTCGSWGHWSVVQWLGSTTTKPKWTGPVITYTTTDNPLEHEMRHYTLAIARFMKEYDAKVTEITFTSDTGGLFSEQDTFKDIGQPCDEPEWKLATEPNGSDGINWPIVETMSTDTNERRMTACVTVDITPDDGRPFAIIGTMRPRGMTLVGVSDGTTLDVPVESLSPLPTKICELGWDSYHYHYDRGVYTHWSLEFLDDEGGQVDLGLTGPHRVFVTYGPNTATGGMSNYFEEEIPTIKRMEFLVRAAQREWYEEYSPRATTAHKVAAAICARHGGRWAGPPPYLWEALDNWRFECDSARVLATVGMMMLGTSQAHLQWTKDEGCHAYPSTDHTTGCDSIGRWYYSDCTDCERPSDFCNWPSWPPPINCTMLPPDKHPAHPSDEVEGEPCEHGDDWQLHFAGGLGPMENFFKVMDDDGDWYYVAVTPLKMCIGSSGQGDELDRAGRYYILKDAGFGQIWGREEEQYKYEAPSFPLP